MRNKFNLTLLLLVCLAWLAPKTQAQDWYDDFTGGPSQPWIIGATALIYGPNGGAPATPPPLANFDATFNVFYGPSITYNTSYAANSLRMVDTKPCREPGVTISFVPAPINGLVPYPRMTFPCYAVAPTGFPLLVGSGTRPNPLMFTAFNDTCPLLAPAAPEAGYNPSYTAGGTEPFTKPGFLPPNRTGMQHYNWFPNPLTGPDVATGAQNAYAHVPNNFENVRTVATFTAPSMANAARRTYSSLVARADVSNPLFPTGYAVFIYWNWDLAGTIRILPVALDPTVTDGYRTLSNGTQALKSFVPGEKLRFVWDIVTDGGQPTMKLWVFNETGDNQILTWPAAASNVNLGNGTFDDGYYKVSTAAIQYTNGVSGVAGVQNFLTLDGGGTFVNFEFDNIGAFNLPGNCQWTGAAGTDYSSLANWGPMGRPERYASGTINDVVNKPVMAANREARSLTIEPGAALSLGNNTLRINESILIRSIANGSEAATGALVSAGGGSLTGAGTLTVERFVPSIAGINRLYSYLSAPISGITIGDLGISNGQGDGATYDPCAGAWPGLANIFRYDETNTTLVPSPCNNANPVVQSEYGWIGYTAAGNPMTSGMGLAANFNGGVTFSFDGLTSNYVSGNIPRSLTNTASGDPSMDGLNLLGNPYTAPLDWEAIVPDLSPGIENTVRFWSEENNDYATYQAGGASVLGGTRLIPIGQGFVVRTVANETFVFRPNHQTMTSEAVFWKQSSAVPKLRLVALAPNTRKSELLISFRDDATHGYEPKADAVKLYSTREVPAIYSYATTGEPLTINGMGSLTGPTIIPVDMIAKTSGLHTITATELENFTPGTVVFLHDKHTDHLQDLTLEPSYQFTSTVADASDRFEIIINPVILGTGTALQAPAASVWVAQGDLNVALTQAAAAAWRVELLDLNGRVVFASEAQPAAIQQASFAPQGLSNGLYIVRMSGGVQHTQKVIFNR